MKKKIKLMPDYYCSPLWDISEGIEIDINTLSLSSQTKERLKKWAELYDETLNFDDPLSSGFKNGDILKEFEIEGNNLWELLIKEIGQDYEIFYFSHLKAKLLSKMGL